VHSSAHMGPLARLGKYLGVARSQRVRVRQERLTHGGDHKVVPLDVVETTREGPSSLLERNRLAGNSELGNGQDIPKLRTALETIISAENYRGLRSRPVLPVNRPARNDA